MTRRKATTKQAQPAANQSPVKPPLYKRLWLVAVGVGTIAFTLGLNGPTLLQNIRKLPVEVEITRDQYLGWLKKDAEWAGDWSNFPEGHVDMADMRLSEGVDLKITLQSKNGELDGTITSGRMCSNLPVFDFLLLRGSVSGNTAAVEVWDIIGGHQRTFENLRLVREGNVITVQPERGASSWFPADARIGRHPETTIGFMNGACNRKARFP